MRVNIFYLAAVSEYLAKPLVAVKRSPQSSLRTKVQKSTIMVTIVMIVSDAELVSNSELAQSRGSYDAAAGS